MRIPWWARPSILVAMATLPGLLLLHLMSADHLQTLWKTDKFETPLTLGLSLAMVAFLVLGVELGLARRPLPSRPVRDVPQWQAHLALRVGTVLGWIALAAYAFFIVLAVSRGADLSVFRSLLSAQTPDGAMALRTQLAPIGGVTTAVQFAPPAVALLTAGSRLLGRRLPWQVWTLLALATLRALANSERLALLEVAIPIAFVSYSLGHGRVLRRVAAAAPVLAPTVLLVYFGVFERFRSWAFYRGSYAGSYPHFVFDRVSGYYVTAANNDALFYTQFRGTLPAPYFSFPGLWEAPGLSRILDYQAFFGISPINAWTAQLAAANPEFNNWGTLLIWVSELGIAAAAVLWIASGVALGRLYAAVRRGSLTGLVTFGCVLVWMLELGRTPGFVAGRSVPVLLGLLAFWVAVRVRTEMDARRAAAATSPATAPASTPAEPVGLPV